jgi:DNA polymerase-3 subunit beta
MTPGLTLILKAPGCKKLLLLDTFLSGNNMGGVYWTDGLVAAPMLPSESGLQKSPSEGVIFWLDECEEVGSIPFDDPTPEEAEAGRTLERAKQLSEEDYLRAIEKPVWKTKKQECYVRIRYWREGNHALRRGEIEALPQKHLDNLDVLLDLLSENKPDQRMMKAEVLRELGRFAEAIKLLQYRFSKDSREAARQILALCRAQHRTVAKFQHSDVVLEPAVKLRINREKFAEGLERVLGLAKLADPKKVDPIFGHVLIRAEKGGLDLTTTCFDTFAHCHLPAEVSKEGIAALSAKFLSRIVRGMMAVDIDLEVDDFFAATIKGGSSLFHLEGRSAAEFPKIPELSEPRILRMEQKTLRELLCRTAYARSEDELRFNLSGVMLSLEEGRLAVVATDGHRLAIAENEMHIPEGCIREFIISQALTDQVLDLLKDEGEVTISFTFDQVLFHANDTELIGKRILEGYPKYKQLFPIEAKAVVLLQRTAFLGAIRRAALLARGSHEAVHLQFSKNSLVITDSKDGDDSKETLAIEYDGPDFWIRLNTQYLMDPLFLVEIDHMRLEFTDEDAPAVLRMGDRFRYAIMPMRAEAK